MSPAVKNPAYRFRNDRLVISDDIAWPTCDDVTRAGLSCTAEATHGYVNLGSISFSCKVHTRENRHEDRDPWPLIPESEMRDVDSSF